MSPEGRIEINPKVMLGKPVIRGMRITVGSFSENSAKAPRRRDLLEA
jgi:uncharacterized protein (DUF433 family)